MQRSPGAASLFPRAMSPAWRSAPVVLCVFEELTLLRLLLLLLLLNPTAVQSECSLPPDMPNAQPSLGGRTSFPENHKISYRCNKGFVKIPGRPNTIVCQNNKWTEIAQFCNRTCEGPPRLSYARLKKIYIEHSYFPEGMVLEYECSPGYNRNHTLSGKITCLPNFKWSQLAEFCSKKSCPDPGEIKNGYVNITTDILYASTINFSCDRGYRLVGETYSFCVVIGNKIQWSNPLPECEEITCPKPPQIENGKIQMEMENYVYNNSVTYICEEGFTLMGQNSINCVVNEDQGEWSSLPPRCEEITCPKPPQIENGKIQTEMENYVYNNSVTYICEEGFTLMGQNSINCVAKDDRGEWSSLPPRCEENHTATNAPTTSQKPTTVNDPSTESLSTTQQPTSANLPGTEAPPAPQNSTSANQPTTESPVTSQEPTLANQPTTESPLITQGLTSENQPTTETPLTTQEPTSENQPTVESPLTTQEPTIVTLQELNTTECLAILSPNASTSNCLPSPQKPTSGNLPATKYSLTAQNPTSTNLPTAETLLTAQKPSATDASVTEVSATAQTLPVSKTSPAAQSPITGNAAQTTATTQRTSTVKASFTQRTTQRSTAKHAPATRGLQTTRTSALMTANPGLAVPRATTRFHTTSTAKGRGTLPSSGTMILASGLVAATVLIGIIIVAKIIYNYGKSGIYM